MTFQVDLDKDALLKLADERGFVNKSDFVKLGQDLKLLDFGGALGDKRKVQSPRPERKRPSNKEEGKV